MRSFIRVLLGLSLVANVALAFLLWLRGVRVVSTENQYAYSPNTNFIAAVNAGHEMNPLWPGPDRDFYEFFLETGPGQPAVKRVLFFPGETNAVMAFGQSSPVISWSPDSSNVTFAVPGMTLTLDTKPHR